MSNVTSNGIVATEAPLAVITIGDVKRGRGRPPKSSISGGGGDQAIKKKLKKVDAEGQPMRRGRPSTKKVASSINEPIANDVVNAAINMATSPTVPKAPGKRGRPAGSGGLKKAKYSSASGSGGSGRPRGRPKAVVQSPQKSKATAAMSASSLISAVPASAAVIAPITSSAVVNSITPKKGRGRPPKAASVASVANKKTSSPASKPATGSETARPRGRPRKS